MADTRMQIRTTTERKERWTEAAGGKGKLSQWVEETLDRAAVEKDVFPREGGPHDLAFVDEALNLLQGIDYDEGSRVDRAVTALEAFLRGDDSTSEEGAAEMPKTPDEATTPSDASSSDADDSQSHADPELEQEGLSVRHGPGDSITLTNENKARRITYRGHEILPGDSVTFSETFMASRLYGDMINEGGTPPESVPPEEGSPQSQAETLVNLGEVLAPDKLLEVIRTVDDAREALARIENVEDDGPPAGHPDSFIPETTLVETESGALAEVPISEIENAVPDIEDQLITRRAVASAQRPFPTTDKGEPNIVLPVPDPEDDRLADETITGPPKHLVDKSVLPGVGILVGPEGVMGAITNIDEYDDTAPEPEDPKEFPPPTMLEPVGAEAIAQAALTQPSLRSDCTNAAMHWQMTRGEQCRSCKGIA